MHTNSFSPNQTQLLSLVTELAIGPDRTTIAVINVFNSENPISAQELNRTIADSAAEHFLICLSALPEQFIEHMSEQLLKSTKVRLLTDCDAKHYVCLYRNVWYSLNGFSEQLSLPESIADFTSRAIEKRQWSIVQLNPELPPVKNHSRRSQTEAQRALPPQAVVTQETNQTIIIETGTTTESPRTISSDKGVKTEEDQKRCTELLAEFQSLQSQQRISESISVLSKAIAILPNLFEVQVHLLTIDFLISEGQFDEAHSAIKNLRSGHPYTFDSYDREVKIALHQGRVHEAIAVFETLGRERPELYTHSVGIHPNHQLPGRIGRLRDELDESNDLVTSALDGVPIQHPAHAQFATLCGHIISGDLAQALLGLEELIQTHKGVWWLHQASAAALSAWGRLTQRSDILLRCAQEFNRVQELIPDSSDVAWRAARALAESPSPNAAEVNRRYKEAIENNRSNPEPFWELADRLTRAGERKEAAEYLKLAYQAMEIRANEHPIGRAGIRILDSLNTYAFGHLAELPDIYIKMMELGWMPRYKTILLANPWRVSNMAMLNCWSRYFDIVTDPIQVRKLRSTAAAITFNSAYFKMPNGNVYGAPISKSFVQQEWERQGRKPLLSISESEIERGWNQLQKWGIPRNAWFVGLHAREGGYKSEGGCRFNHHRNCDIDTYKLAIEAITSRGGWVIRMGESSMKPLPKMANVIDYAHSKDKSDWMEVFLCSQSRLFVTSCAGIFGTPLVFGTPSVCTNFPPMSPLHYNSHDLYLPKLPYSDRESRFIGLREIIEPQFYMREDGGYFDSCGIRFIDNSAEEIREVTLEMLERLEGNSKYSDDDNVLQERFRNRLKPEDGVIIIRGGREFLRRYKELL